MKIVVETNVLISFLIGKSLSGFLDKVLQQKVKVFSSSKQMIEIASVLRREKFQKYFIEQDIKEFLALLFQTFHYVKPTRKIKACRDAKDNYILEIADEGDVDYIITGDDDLLVLNPFKEIKIITPRKFEKILPSL